MPESLLNRTAFLPGAVLSAVVVFPAPGLLDLLAFRHVFQGDGLVGPVLLFDAVDEIALGLELAPRQRAQALPLVDIIGAVPVGGNAQFSGKEGFQQDLVPFRDPLHPQRAAFRPAPGEEIFHRSLQVSGTDGAHKVVISGGPGFDEQKAVLLAEFGVIDIPPDKQVPEGILVAGDVLFPQIAVDHLPVAEFDGSKLQHKGSFTWPPAGTGGFFRQFPPGGADVPRRRSG